MFYLGIDGGGTKTAFILINESGDIAAYTTRPTCHYVQVGINIFQEVLTKGIIEVCTQASIKKEEIDFSFLGLPGYGENKDDAVKMENIVGDILENNRFRCGNDVEAGWAGSLACHPGINLVGGTGAIGFAKDGNGNSARASGWGYFCGDEGSAYWFGRQLISLFGKQADGREEKTEIYDIVCKEFNLNRDLDFITVVYDVLEKKRDKIASLAVLLYEAVKKGDQRAAELYQKAAYEHSLTVKALVNKLDFAKDEEIMVSYSGGVFKAGLYILKPLKTYIEKTMVGRDIKLIEPILQPITGAALYALLLDKQIDNYEMVVDRLEKEEERLGL